MLIFTSICMCFCQKNSTFAFHKKWNLYHFIA